LDEKGNENKSLPPKEGSARALSSFMSNTDEGEEDIDFHPEEDDNE
jgi:integration host factor subunit alpha